MRSQEMPVASGCNYTDAAQYVGCQVAARGWPQPKYMGGRKKKMSKKSMKKSKKSMKKSKKSMKKSKKSKKTMKRRK